MFPIFTKKNNNMKNFKFFIILTLSFNYSCDNLTNKAPKCSDESVKNEAIKTPNKQLHFLGFH